MYYQYVSPNEVHCPCLYLKDSVPTLDQSSIFVLHKTRSSGKGGAERDRDRQTQKERERDRQTDRQSVRWGSNVERERERERQTDRERERDRQTDRQTDRQRQRALGTNVGILTFLMYYFLRLFC